MTETKLEDVLKKKLESIFGFKKVSLDRPSESQEQECLFVQIDTPNYKVRAGVETARVQGSIRFWVNSEKASIGYMIKRIEEASKEDKKNFHFFNIEESNGTLGNICERSAGFIFFFRSQYDPNHGQINNVTVQEVNT